MKKRLLALWLAALCAAPALYALPALGAPTLAVAVNGRPYTNKPVSVSVGKPLVIEFTLSGATTGQLYLPSVPQLASHGGSGTPGDKLSTFSFFLTPTRPGDITIPAFDIVTSGGKLPIKPIRLHAEPAP
jgi:hypothetical protein